MINNDIIFIIIPPGWSWGNDIRVGPGLGLNPFKSDGGL